jgi:hypothetical protein
LPQLLRVALLALAPCCGLGISLAHGPAFIDDAYITFRYAHNLAHGAGLVWNPGEALLGTTSPLMAAGLALAERAGVPILIAARGFGILGAVGALFAVQMLALERLGLAAAVSVGLGVVLQPDWAFCANSGMETALSMCAVYTALWLALRNRARSAGLCVAVACLLRPDGMLLAAVGGARFWLNDRRNAARFGVYLVLGALPWVLYALHAYGTALPHSVEAKRLIHADLPAHIAFVSLRRMTRGVEMSAVVSLAALGAVLAARSRSDLVWVLLWFALQFTGLCAAGIAPLFPWYVSPLFPALFLFANLAVFALCRRATWRRRPEWWAVALMLALYTVGQAQRGSWQRATYQAAFGDRVDEYLRIAANLRARVRPGDSVLVGEAGALGFALPEQIILDSSGINSRELYLLRASDAAAQAARGVTPDAEGSPDWVRAALERFQPRFVVSYLPWLHMNELVHDPQVMRDYARLWPPVPSRYVVLERRVQPGVPLQPPAAAVLSTE